MQSIPLLHLTNQKITLNQPALSLISSHEGPLSVISACGQYRTGKSFLLNTIFNPECFAVSPTTQPCTKGITMGTVPLRCGDMNVWVLDTEGFGAMEQDGTYDAKIFLLGILLSEVVIYNSMGSLDEVSIQKIALMCRQAMVLTRAVENQEEEEIESQWMMEREVDLCWVVRDFALALTDKNGDAIDADRYLEQALESNSQKLDHERKIIKKVFKNRKCFPLVRPCISQPDLQSLKQLPSSSLRPQFLLQLNSLKSHILSTIRPKTVLNTPITGSQFCHLLRQYTRMLNSSNFDTSLTVTWQQVQEYHIGLILEQIQGKIGEKLGQYGKFMPVTEDDLRRFRKEVEFLYGEAIGKLGDGVSIRGQFEEIVGKEIGHFLQQNNEKLQEKCSQYLDENYIQITTKLQKLPLTTNFNQKIEQSIQKLHTNYQLRFKNYTKQITTHQYTKTLTKLLSWVSKKLLPKFQSQLTEKDITISNLQKKQKLNEQQIYSQFQQETILRQELKKLEQMSCTLTKEKSEYEEIIQRMERVNENLRMEFGILSVGEDEQRKAYEGRIAQYEQMIKVQLQKSQTLKSELKKQQNQLQQTKSQVQSLQTQLQQTHQSHFNQLQTKKQTYLQLLTTQRQQFNTILMENNTKQSELRREIVELGHNIEKEQERYERLREKDIREIRCQYEEKDRERRAEMERMHLLANQLRNQIQLLTTQNKQLNSDIQYNHKQLQTQTTQLLQLSNTNHQLQQKIHLAFQQHTLQVQQYQKKQQNLSIELQQYSIKIEELSQQLLAIRAKNARQLQNMHRKMEENIQHCNNTSFQKYQLTRKELQLQKQAIADKLIQAAQHIEKMVQKQKKMMIKLTEYQDILKRKEEDMEQIGGTTEELRAIVEVQAVQIEKLKRRVQEKEVKEQEMRNIMEMGNGRQGRARSVKQNQNSAESQQIMKNKLDNYQKQNEKLIKQLTYLKNQKHSSSSTNTSNSQRNNNSLALQNSQLKKQLAQQKQQNQKYQSQIFKKINFHSLLKKLKQKQNTGSLTSAPNNPQWHISQQKQLQQQQKKSKQLYQYIEQLHTQILDLRTQICQLHELAYLESTQLTALRDTLQQKDQEINQYERERLINREREEERKAQWEVERAGMGRQLEGLGRKCGILAKEVSLWKMTANQYEGAREGRVSYREKIDDLFNKI